MDQKSLLASLVQLNASALTRMAAMPAAAGQHGMSVGLAASPCFSAPGLTLQGFQGSSARGPPQQGTPLLVDSVASLQTLLNTPPQQTTEEQGARLDAGAAARKRERERERETFLAAHRPMLDAAATERGGEASAAQAAPGEAADACRGGKRREAKFPCTVPFIVTLYSRYTRTLTFQNLLQKGAGEQERNYSKGSGKGGGSGVSESSGGGGGTGSGGGGSGSEARRHKF